MSSIPELSSANQEFRIGVDCQIPRNLIECEKSLKNKLGDGCMGVTYKGRLKQDAPVAIKFLRESNLTVQKALQFEVQKLHSLQHPKIITLYGVQSSSSPFCLVYELAACSLYEALYTREEKHPLRIAQNNFERKVQILFDCCDAIKFIHENYEAHGNIKCSNVLLTTDGTVKLTGFGFMQTKQFIAKAQQKSIHGVLSPSKTSSSATNNQSFLTPYLAPELLLGPKETQAKPFQPTPNRPQATTANTSSAVSPNVDEFSSETDVYAFGILMNEILDHAPPFPNLTQQNIITRLKRADASSRPLLFARQEELWIDNANHESFSSLQRMIQQCWRDNPAERMTFEELEDQLLRILDHGIVKLVEDLPQSPQRYSLDGRHVTTTVLVNGENVSNAKKFWLDKTTAVEGGGEEPVDSSAKVTIPSLESKKESDIETTSNKVVSEVVSSNKLSSVLASYSLPSYDAAAIEHLYYQASFCANVEARTALLSLAYEDEIPLAEGLVMVMLFQGNGVIKDVDLASALYGKIRDWLHQYSDMVIHFDVPEEVAYAKQLGIPYIQYILGVCYEYGIGMDGPRFATAVYYYTLSAKYDYVTAQVNLGYCYKHGLGLDQDVNKAIRLFTAGVTNAQHVEAIYQLACIYFHSPAQETDLGEAVKLYEIGAQLGHIACINALGYCHEHGIGTEVNLVEAVRLYSLAADGGLAIAQYNLGYCYYHGLGVEEKDLEKAVEYYQLAAMQGHMDAQCHLAYCYEFGKGMDSADIAEAMHYYHLSAEQGHSTAQNTLGEYYKQGKYVTKDITKAVDYFILSATQGNPFAQNNLGYCYQHGEGVNQDYAQAIVYYTLSAEQGNAIAQNNLGYCFQHGLGISQSYTSAAEWYGEAAKQGYAAAQYNLGYCYAHGLGVPVNHEEAYRLYVLSANQGNSMARQCVEYYQTHAAGNNGGNTGGTSTPTSSKKQSHVHNTSSNSFYGSGNTRPLQTTVTTNTINTVNNINTNTINAMNTSSYTLHNTSDNNLLGTTTTETVTHHHHHHHHHNAPVPVPALYLPTPPPGPVGMAMYLPPPVPQPSAPQPAGRSHHHHSQLTITPVMTNNHGYAQLLPPPTLVAVSPTNSNNTSTYHQQVPAAPRSPASKKPARDRNASQPAAAVPAPAPATTSTNPNTASATNTTNTKKSSSLFKIKSRFF